MIGDTMESELLEDARAAGFLVVDDPELSINKDAARLLPASMGALGVDVAGDVLSAVTDFVPTPDEFAQMQASCGMLLTLSVAVPRVYQQICERVEEPNADGTALVSKVLTRALELGATDVHLSVGAPPRLRIGGRIKQVEKMPILSVADMEASVRWVAGDALDNFSGDHDCAITYGGSRWRISVYRQRASFALAIRRIPSEVPRVDELGLPVAVKNLSSLSRGLVLFCGPTGHGKSTSLAAILDQVNRSRECHILTIEDPIEYVHSEKMAMVHQREVGHDADTKNFATALRHALRQDPDVILVGELRDLETMSAALSAAETGHLVFATVHASSAAGAFTRIIDAFPASQQDQVRTQMAGSIQAVVCQLLLPSSTDPRRRELATEILIADSAVRNIVRDGRLQEITTTLDSSRGKGMTSMDRSLALLAAGGRITREMAETHLVDEKSFIQHFDAAPKSGVVARGFDDDLVDL